MKFLLLVSLLLASAYAQQCGRPAITPKETLFGRIVGGENAIKNSWPWQIHLGYKQTYFGIDFGTQYICGGSIISNKWIVTAAHCVDSDPNAKNYIIRVGQHNSALTEATARDYTVKRVIKHSGYNSNNMNNDIALIEVESTIAMTNAVSTVCLPAANSDPAAGVEVVATGWGETTAYGREAALARSFLDTRAPSTILRQVKMSMVSRATCNLGNYYGGAILPSMICAGTTGKDACQGDSGGPLVSKNSAGAYELVGVTSWGEGCGAVRRPGVYARTGMFVPWIKQNTGL